MNIAQPDSTSRVSTQRTHVLPRPPASATSGFRAWRKQVEEGPVAVIHENPTEVLETARADRFIAAG